MATLVVALMRTAFYCVSRFGKALWATTPTGNRLY
jgi:hypothetical protein